MDGVLEETCWEESSASVAAMYPIDDFSYIIFLFYFPHPTRGPWCRFPPLVGWVSAGVADKSAIPIIVATKSEHNDEANSDLPVTKALFRGQLV